jgi:hypothetical protein
MKVIGRLHTLIGLFPELIELEDGWTLELVGTQVAKRKIHGAELFLRSCQSLSYSRISQHFMELQGLLSCSQEPSTGPYPKPDQPNPITPSSL